jgi:hypothetical protein
MGHAHILLLDVFEIGIELVRMRRRADLALGLSPFPDEQRSYFLVVCHTRRWLDYYCISAEVVGQGSGFRCDEKLVKWKVFR